MGLTKPNVPVAGVPVAGAAAAKVTDGMVKDVPVVATNAIPVVPAVPVKATAATPVVAVPVSTKAATLEQVVEVPKTVGVPKPVELLRENATPVDKVVEVEKIVRWGVAGRVVRDNDEHTREGSYSVRSRAVSHELFSWCSPLTSCCLIWLVPDPRTPSTCGALNRWRRRSLWRWRRSSMSSAPWKSSRRSRWSRRYVGLERRLGTRLAGRNRGGLRRGTLPGAFDCQCYTSRGSGWEDRKWILVLEAKRALAGLAPFAQRMFTSVVRGGILKIDLAFCSPFLLMLFPSSVRPCRG